MSIQFQYYDTVAHGYTGILTVTGGTLITDGSGVPSFSATLPTGVQDNITRVGTITSGVWNAGAVSTAGAIDGGTVAAAGAFTTSGAGAVYNFQARDLAQIWAWYATGGVAALYNGAANAFTVTVAGHATALGYVATAGYTVATLPTPGAGNVGAMAYVTDALAPTFLATIVGGGAIITPVFCNGTNWVGA